MQKKTKKILHCAKCGYEWESRKDNPKECPACKNRNWKENPKEEGK